MCRYVAVVSLMVVIQFMEAAPPVHVTIDCPSEENDNPDFLSSFRAKSSSKSSTRPDQKLDVSSVCDLINTAIPKAVKDGHFILLKDRSADQDALGDTFAPISVPPPKGFIPKLPKLTPSKLNIPKLKIPPLITHKRQLLAPKVGSPKPFITFRVNEEEESSAEKLENFKKVVQKLLHVVKVVGKVDQYISERTRIVVEKLSKTLAE